MWSSQVNRRHSKTVVVGVSCFLVGGLETGVNIGCCDTTYYLENDKIGNSKAPPTTRRYLLTLLE